MFNSMKWKLFPCIAMILLWQSKVPVGSPHARNMVKLLANEDDSGSFLILDRQIYGEEGSGQTSSLFCLL